MILKTKKHCLQIIPVREVRSIEPHPPPRRTAEAHRATVRKKQAYGKSSLRVARSELRIPTIARNTLAADIRSSVCARNFTHIAWKMFLTMYWRWKTIDLQNISSYAHHHHHAIDKTHCKSSKA